MCIHSLYTFTHKSVLKYFVYKTLCLIFYMLSNIKCSSKEKCITSYLQKMFVYIVDKRHSSPDVHFLDAFRKYIFRSMFALIMILESQIVSQVNLLFPNHHRLSHINKSIQIHQQSRFRQIPVHRFSEMAHHQGTLQ